MAIGCEMAWPVSHVDPLWAVFCKRWVACLLTAVGIAWACVSSVRIAAVLAGCVARLLGLESVDVAVRSIV